ncbi:MAG: hypothetical protein JNM70_19625 [Anaerolineae bacterium]|nr:hypothetical protein [Anaerolineae bacterium]
MKKGFYRYAQCALWVLMTCAGIYVLLLVCAIALNPVILVNSIRGNAMPTPVEETFSLPVNTASDVLTMKMYDKWVTITIWGEGQIDAETRHDAFRSYSSDGSVEGFYGFLVDGEGLILRVFSLAPARTNQEISEYVFAYPVGDPPRQIAFRMVNGNPDDKSVFIVRVDSRDWLFSPGR